MGLVRTFVFSVAGVVIYVIFFIFAVIITGAIIDYNWNGSIGEIAPMFILPLVPLGIILYGLAMFFNPDTTEGEYAGDNIYTHARDRAHRKAGKYREKAGEYFEKAQQERDEAGQEGKDEDEDADKQTEQEAREKEAYERGKREASSEAKEKVVYRYKVRKLSKAEYGRLVNYWQQEFFKAEKEGNLKRKAEANDKIRKYQEEMKQ